MDQGAFKVNFPFIQFFIKDHLADEKLSRCDHASRSIWLEFVFAMHLDDRCGLISGTRPELARIGRCTEIELAHALDQLHRYGAADVMERDGNVTLVNRRMRKEWKKRNQNRLRVKKHRDSESVTPDVTQKKPPREEYGCGSDSSEGGSGGNSKPPPPPDVREMALEVLIFLNEVAHRQFRSTPTYLTLIEARLKEVDLDLPGIKTMISRMVAKWRGTEYEEYLQPDTLFGKKKFQGYYDNRELALKPATPPKPTPPPQPELPVIRAGQR